MHTEHFAPGWPGIAPRWTSSAKSGVGTALAASSRVWFTLSHGIFNEIYYPEVDWACTRDAGMLVTDGATFFSEEKRHTVHTIHALGPGVPGYRIVNACTEGRYRIEKRIIGAPRHDAVLQETVFTPLLGTLGDYHLYMLLAPHLGNRGAGNTAWLGDYKGVPMLFAERDGTALALACSTPWLARTVGFAGVSDGWRDLVDHKRLTTTYERAENGNVALMGEVDIARCGGRFVLAIGFGRDWAKAAHRARAALDEGFALQERQYLARWEAWQRTLLPLESAVDPPARLYRDSMAVLRTHESKSFPSVLIASLSVPWGFTKGDDDMGGYHLVWPRDLVESAGGLIAAGAGQDMIGALDYLLATQEADGHWPQNMWLDGMPFWNGIQMDETAFPILLVDLALREGCLPPDALPRLWPMIRRAASYIVRNGPVSQQDRWEEDAGYSPFTLAVQVAALLVAADHADRHGEPGVAAYLRETADTWNGEVERWTYVTGTPLAAQVGVPGYYVRVAPAEVAEGASPMHGFVPIKNRPPGSASAAADAIVSPDALALVRFGLRAADDPRILDTVRVIDALLRVDTSNGPVWHRYTQDGYGEHDDGAPFDGVGVGRGWPLLVGERAHYELALGRRDRAEALLRTMERFASETGLLPEQVWDARDLPARELFNGRPAGSAMPLAWAHAEYVKLCRSLRDGRVFDMPPQTRDRYVVHHATTTLVPWRFNNKRRSMRAGATLRIETLYPVVVHWSADGWHTVHDTPSRDTGIGEHVTDLPTEAIGSGHAIDFTFYWPGAGHWEGADFVVAVD